MSRIPNLHTMSLDDLKALAKDVEKAILKVEREYLKKARDAAEEAAKKFGFSLDDLAGGGRKSSKAARNSAAPKYRNPDNPAETWSGRGRQPNWYKAALEAGKKPEDMAIG